MQNHLITNNILSLKKNLRDRGVKDNVILSFIKEELQNYILFALYTNPKTAKLIFYGGTCIRKIYKIDRLSEDLDFEMENEENSVDAKTVEKVVKDYFTSLKYSDVDSSIQENGNIIRVTFKFRSFVSNVSEKSIHIKVEINKNIDKKIGKIQTSAYSSGNLGMTIRHYSLETLMSSKIIACINRTERKIGLDKIEFKGRDFYDLIWYMGKGVKPDEERIKHSLNMSSKEAFDILDKRIKTVKREFLYKDLSAFIENDVYLNSWCDHFLEFYKDYRKNY
jgi:predicted nucleotidyltransferase component of viral defense system